MDRYHVPSDHDDENVREIGFALAFQVELELAGTPAFETPRGDRLFQAITGGQITGRIFGTVYPHGGAQFGVRHQDWTSDIVGHILLRDEDGEWLYIRNLAIARQDGYWRATAWVDADVRGKHAWTASLFFVGIGRPNGNGGMSIAYYEVL